MKLLCVNDNGLYGRVVKGNQYEVLETHITVVVRDELGQTMQLDGNRFKRAIKVHKKGDKRYWKKGIQILGI